MEKTLTGIAALTLGIIGAIFVLVGLVNYAVLPEPGSIIGGVFAIIGIAFLLMTLMLVRMARRYQQKAIDAVIHGRKIQAHILEVREIRSISVNRRHPFVLICEAEGRTFESDYFYRDVHRFDERESVDVYLDDDSDDYYVDIES